MKKLAYISNDCFLDVDRRIVCELNKYYKIHYFVIYENKLNYIYTPSEVASFCDANDIIYTQFLRSKRAIHPTNIGLAYTVISAIKAFHPDAIYFESFSDPYLPVMAKLLLDTQKIIIGIHDVISHREKNRPITAELNFLFMFKNIHVFSETQKKELLVRHPDKNVFVARLSTYDYGAIAQHRDSDNTTRFLFFGSIRYNKGLELLIEAGNVLASKKNNFTITIAGNCTDFTYYDDLIKYRDFFDLKIRFIKHSEIPMIFGEADFIVLPYLDVTQSGPLMIAFNYKVLPIASNLPGFNEYISHGKNGFLFGTADPAALASCMEHALSLSKTDKEVMISNMANFIKNELSIDSVVACYRTMFDDVSVNKS